MSKIQSIIKSGIAPGFTGQALPPCSIAALKGLKTVEDEPIYKHGPSRGAKRIEKYFGLGSAGSIKRKWETPFRPRPKRVIEAACCLLAGFLLLGSVKVAEAGYIVSGETFYDGMTVHSSDLNNAIQNATIQFGFISTQPINTTPLTSDYLLEYSPTLNGLYKISLISVISNPAAYTMLSQGYPNYGTNDLFQFYSQGGGQIESIIYSNLVAAIVTNFPVNYSYAQTFFPWTVYGTNTAFPYTNSFGYTTNFAITNLYMPALGTSNILALLPTDTIPINSGMEGTNATATLQAITQYTARNIPYGRVQFSGTTVTIAISNLDTATGFFTNVTDATDFTNITAVSFASPYAIASPALASNTVYFVQITNANPFPTLQLFSTFTNAVARSSPILGTSANNTNRANMFWCTNFNSINAVAIQDATGGAAARTGVYDIDFLTPVPLANYYVEALCLEAAGATRPSSINLNSDNVITTNNFRISVYANDSLSAVPLIQIYVLPP